MSELEEKVQEEFEKVDGTPPEEGDLMEQESVTEQSRKEENIFNQVADVVKNTLNDGSVYIIMGDYVGQNEGIIAGENARFRNIDFAGQSRRKNNNIKNEKSGETVALFDDENEICKWMKKNFGNKNFLWIISLSVFYDMPYSWVKRNAEVLKSKQNFGVENEGGVDEIITKDELLKSIGAFTYMDVIISNSGDTECEFVGFVDENAAERILKCLWMQFGDYREGVLEWLKLFAYQAERAQAYHAVRAISFVAQLDYYYFETHMLQKFVSDEHTDRLAEIMYLISQNESYTEKINKIAKHWGTLSKCSYLLVALSIAQKNRWSESEIKPIMSKYISGTINAVQKTWLEDYSQKFPHMFIIGNRASDYYKAMVAAVYKQRYMEKNEKINREGAEQIFLMMVETDFEYTRVTKEDMVLVNMLFIRNDYEKMLKDLWKQLWRKHTIHRQVKDMITTYWKQRCSWNLNYEKQMVQFFNKINVSEREQQTMYRKVLGGEEIWMQ